MSDLTSSERRTLERLLGMGSSRVLDFSRRAFAEFIADCVGRNIYDARYDNASCSMANRLRVFWVEEDNEIVGRVIDAMLNYAAERGVINDSLGLSEACRTIVTRLLQTNSVADLED